LHLLVFSMQFFTATLGTCNLVDNIKVESPTSPIKLIYNIHGDGDYHCILICIFHHLKLGGNRHEYLLVPNIKQNDQDIIIPPIDEPYAYTTYRFDVYVQTSYMDIKKQDYKNVINTIFQGNLSKKIPVTLMGRFYLNIHPPLIPTNLYDNLLRILSDNELWKLVQDYQIDMTNVPFDRWEILKRIKEWSEQQRCKHKLC